MLRKDEESTLRKKRRSGEGLEQTPTIGFQKRRQSSGPVSRNNTHFQIFTPVLIKIELNCRREFQKFPFWSVLGLALVSCLSRHLKRRSFLVTMVLRPLSADASRTGRAGGLALTDQCCWTAGWRISWRCSYFTCSSYALLLCVCLRIINLHKRTGVKLMNVMVILQH